MYYQIYILRYFANKYVEAGELSLINKCLPQALDSNLRVNVLAINKLFA